jgi:glycosyltransferase involved in cell wall biosynthesis
VENPAPPLVSVICLCHRQAPYVRQALASVVAQTYPAIELLIVDDASPDASPAEIEAWLAQAPPGRFVRPPVYQPLASQQGNCRAFNLALAQAQGEYIIDLAADDWLHPDRVATQVAAFAQLPSNYGVVFHDAWLTDAQGQPLRTFYARDAQGRLRAPVPSGWVYAALVGRACLSAPTMMMRRQVLTQLGGYNEALSYEDYDFWVRSARHWRYHFQDQVLTYKRTQPHSHGAGFYRLRHNPHLASTLQVCQHAAALNRAPAENASLAASVRYHFRQAVFTENFALAQQFFALLIQLQPPTWPDRAVRALAWLRPPVGRFYLWFQARRAGR